MSSGLKLARPHPDGLMVMAGRQAYLIAPSLKPRPHGGEQFSGRLATSADLKLAGVEGAPGGPRRCPSNRPHQAQARRCIGSGPGDRGGRLAMTALPLLLTELAEEIGRHLPETERPRWPDRVTAAIIGEAYLSRVWPCWVIWLLRDECPPAGSDPQPSKRQRWYQRERSAAPSCGEQVAALYDRQLSGEAVPASDWEGAAAAAWRVRDAAAAAVAAAEAAFTSGTAGRGTGGVVGGRGRARRGTAGCCSGRGGAGAVCRGS